MEYDEMKPTVWARKARIVGFSVFIPEGRQHRV